MSPISVLFSICEAFFCVSRLRAECTVYPLKPWRDGCEQE